MNGYLSREEVLALGFASVGEDVQISNKACFYGASKMRIGNHVRIDDFCLFVGNITLGNYIHIAAFTNIHASEGSFTMEDYTGLSSGVTVYAASDDYSGNYMTNPTIPSEFVHTIASDIVVGKHVVVGTGSTILPGAIIPEGVSIGAMTLVRGELQPWSIYVGTPCRKIADRSRRCEELEKQMLGLK